MLRVSNYNMYLPLKKDESEFMMIHGYSGAFDVVGSEIFHTLENSKSEEDLLANISKENLDVLEKRGYITRKSAEEEKEAVRKVSDAFHKVSTKNVEITIVPTYNCNFRCSYCFEKRLFEHDCDWLSKTMSIETVDSIFNQVKLFREEGKKVGRVTLFGGEPLLKVNYNLVKYIVEKCRENDITVQCVTNGYFLDEYYDLLGPDGIDSVQITLDGEESVHNKRRFLAGGQPTFEKIVSNISKCLDTGVNIVVRSNVNKKNFQEIANLINLYKQNKWTEYKNFTYYFKSTHACYENSEDVVSDIQVMKELSSIHDDIRKFSFNSVYSGLATTLYSMFSKKSIAPLKGGYCGANIGMYTVDPFGDIYACWDVLGDKKECIGKVNTETKAFEMNERNTYWRDRTTEKIDECVDCKYALFCGGGCAAFAKIDNDDYYSAYCNNFKSIFNEVVPDLYNKLACESNI